jgi:hypothetical protein
MYYQDELCLKYNRDAVDTGQQLEMLGKYGIYLFIYYFFFFFQTG